MQHSPQRPQRRCYIDFASFAFFAVKYFHKNYILIAIPSGGSIYQHTRPPPGHRTCTPNTPASRSWGQNRGCLRSVTRSRVRKFSPISTGRSFLASISILTPVLSLKIRKRFFRLHPFHNRLHINVHFRKIGLLVPLYNPEPQPLIETHTPRLGIHSKVPTAYDPGH